MKKRFARDLKGYTNKKVKADKKRLKDKKKRIKSEKEKLAHQLGKDINREINREVINVYLEMHPCVVCGEDDIDCLEFDHLRDKEYNIAQMTTYKPSAVFAEIAKCQVLCANCHVRKTRYDFATERRQEGEPVMGKRSGIDPNWSAEEKAQYRIRLYEEKKIRAKALREQRKHTRMLSDLLGRKEIEDLAMQQIIDQQRAKDNAG